MSENLNRSTPDFSKYDSMSIGELEEILRADAMGPERADSDVDEILYVMEVLAKKRRQNGIAGKTALEAYQEFQQHYLPMVEEEEDVESVPKRKATVIPFRRIAAVAASLVLVFTLATSANAFSFKDIWNAVVTWAQETFCFSTGVDINIPNQIDTEYTSLQDALDKGGIDSTIIPVYIPSDFELENIIIDRNPKQESYTAIYSNGDSMLKINVQSFLERYPEHSESSNEIADIYTAGGIDFYIFSNYDNQRIIWIIDTYECSISGKLSQDEIAKMLDSINKG